MSYRKYMPRDRVERIDALKRRAALLGLSVQVANRGSRLVRLYRISFHRGDAPVAGFCELTDAETWLDGGAHHRAA
jgi:hypothetical protein